MLPQNFLLTPRLRLDNHIIVTRPLGDPQISRTIGIVRRRAATLSPAAEHFRRMGTWQGEQQDPSASG
jgi:hypothetical protein